MSSQLQESLCFLALSVNRARKCVHIHTHIGKHSCVHSYLHTCAQITCIYVHIVEIINLHWQPEFQFIPTLFFLIFPHSRVVSPFFRVTYSNTFIHLLDPIITSQLLKNPFMTKIKICLNNLKFLSHNLAQDREYAVKYCVYKLLELVFIFFQCTYGMNLKYNWVHLSQFFLPLQPC